MIFTADDATVAVVDLTTAKPTSGGAPITALTVCPVSNGTDSCDGTARPIANGLDQSPLRIKLFGPDGTTVLPTSDPGYGRIYYRDDDGDLITNLVPTDPGQPYVRVSPYPGAYPNDGSTTPVRPSGPVGGRFGYVSTTSTEEQAVYGYVGGYGGGNGGEITVDAGTLLTQLSPSPGSAFTMTNGVYVTGCSGDYSNNNVCKIFSPTAASSTAAGTPALFLTNDPQTNALQIGLQFRYAAQTALNSLPLQQVTGQPEHTVAAAPLVVNNGELTFADAATAFQPGDNIDAYVVVHGQQVPVLNVNVGRAN